VGLLVAALAAIILFVSMAPSLYVVQRAIREKAPAVLTDKAQTLLKDLGYVEKPHDYASAFSTDPAYYVKVEAEKGQKDRLRLLMRPRPGLIYFWYRQSPEAMVPVRDDGAVMEHDPAQLVPGMVTVRLDPHGRLIGLEAEPKDPEAGGGAAATLGAATMAGDVPAWWKPLEEAAEMEMGRFRRVTAVGAPSVYADERLAWEGTFEDAPNEMVRVEAGAYRGRAVYFAMAGGWKEERLSEDKALLMSLGVSNVFVQTAIGAALLAAGSFLAWKNYRSGRGDRQGAHRMALAFFVLGLIVWLFRAHHVPDVIFEFMLFQRGMGAILYLVALVWIFYMAMEPYVRRVWPETVISWTRLLSGKWVDPMVGRDVLAGAAVGALSMLLTIGEYKVPAWLGFSPPLPSINSATQMLTSTRSVASLFNNGITSLYAGLLLLLFLVLVRMVTNRRWAAALVFVMVFALATGKYNPEGPWWRLGPVNLLSFGVESLLAVLILGVMMRHGLVAVIACLLLRTTLINFPVTWDLGAWYSSTSVVAILSVLLLLGGGFYVAMGGRSMQSLLSKEEGRG
jgi:serine/threonine-protein kinase